MNKRLRLGIGAALTIVVIFFVVRALVSQWDSVERFDWQFRPLWLLASAGLVWFDFVLLFHLWRMQLSSISGQRIRFSSAYRISVLANLGKYIPGKVWAVAGMVYLLAGEGVSTQAALVSTALHQAFMLIPGAIFISVVLGTQIWGDFPAPAIAIGLGLSLLALCPPVFSRLLNFGLKTFGRPETNYRLSFARAFLFFWAYILAWVTYGASFWCMTIGLGLPPGPFWTVVAAYGAAYLIGFVALFAPGGLGVREGILTVVLAPYLPVGLSAAVAVISRFWMTIVELAGLVPVAFGYGRPERAGGPDTGVERIPHQDERTR
jgi:uncharacterized membrane protein YbhN (UPF0104 family)